MSLILDSLLAHHHWIAEAIADMTLFDKCQESLFAICGASTVKVIDLKDQDNPTLIRTIDLSGFGKRVKNLVCKDDLVAIAVQSETEHEPGRVVFFKSDGTFISDVMVVESPENITFATDGDYMTVASANERVLKEQQPIQKIKIDLSGGVQWLTQANVIAIV